MSTPAVLVGRGRDRSPSRPPAREIKATTSAVKLRVQLYRLAKNPDQDVALLCTRTQWNQANDSKQFDTPPTGTKRADHSLQEGRGQSGAAGRRERAAKG